MNTDLLRTFIEVARTRHFGHAADNLYLTQSAVSSRIKQLESIVGIAVFTRQKNNILLTPAGERLLPQAENLLTGWQLAIQEAGIPKKQNTQLALGGTSNLWETFLRPMLPKLGGHFQSLHIRTEINSYQHLLRSLLGGRLDIFAAFEPLNNMDINWRRIGKLELIMVCNLPNKRIEDIPEYGHVYVDWGASFNLQQARLFSEAVVPILHTSQCQIALDFILNYRGAAYLPRMLVEQHLTEHRLFQVEDAVQTLQDVFLVYARGADKSVHLGPIITFLEKLNMTSE